MTCAVGKLASGNVRCMRVESLEDIMAGSDDEFLVEGLNLMLLAQKVRK